jgi:hypothetical protein
MDIGFENLENDIEIKIIRGLMDSKEFDNVRVSLNLFEKADFTVRPLGIR